MLKHSNRILSNPPIKFILNKYNYGFLQKRIVTSIQASAMSSSIQKKFALPKKYEGNETSVWVEYIQLAAKYKPLNLGQGFPDFPPPEYVTTALANIAAGPNTLLHQYTRGYGHPRLVNAIAKLYSKLIGKEINPMTEVLVTCGAYEALYAMITGHINPGDEAIIIEPFYDCYKPMIQAVGGKPVFIPLRPKKKDELTSADWVLDKNELSGLFNDKTKFIIINTPHNPTGKVFSMEELQFIADLCKKWNVMCISDEVYEWLVYKPHKHIRIASLPGMWERTVTIGSSGKSFGATGWKIGWAYGPSNLLYNAMVVHQNCIYTCPTPLQEALAVAFEVEISRLGAPECYFNSLAEELLPKRDLMIKYLKEVGMVPTVPDGSYFIVTDWTPLESKVNLSEEEDKYKDYKFTKWMTKNVGLLAIPVTAFYTEAHKHLGENYVRYCFVKKDENLNKAGEILRQWKAKM